MKNRLIFIIIILSFLFSTCKKDELEIYDVTINGYNVIKGTTSVQITVRYTYPTALKSVVGYISQNIDMSDSTSTNGEINDRCFIVRFENLVANTQYFYYYEFNNGVDVIKTAIKKVTTNDYNLPTITTLNVSNITATSATCGGDVTDDGGFEITARGVCWSTTPSPTISNSHTNDGTGVGSFTSTITELTSNTTYYVRAYATNVVGTAYGEQKIISYLPTGAIDGLFSVSATKYVYFSQGNLQYIGSASTPYWKFAEHQWAYLGNNGQGSTYHNVDRDLFGWATSGCNHGAGCYQPWSISTTDSDYYAYGGPSYNLFDQTCQADWGYNSISNGGNQPNQWRTMTKSEWAYVFNTRNTPSGIRYAKAQVNGVNGVILLPDDWGSSYYSLKNTNSSGANFTSNTITASQWNVLEQHGAVFLPAAGWRNSANVNSVNSHGSYWSATYYSSSNAYGVGVNGSGLSPADNGHRSDGNSVRLVCDVE